MARVSFQVIAENFTDKAGPLLFSEWTLNKWVRVFQDFKQRGGKFESVNPFHFIYTTSGNTKVEYKLLSEV